MEIVVAVMVPGLISIALGSWLWISLGHYFTRFVAARGPVPRAKPWFRIGLGLDDLVVGTWDLVPAWRVISQDTVDTELEPARHRARSATLLFLAQLPAGLLLATVLVGLLRTDPVIPAITALVTWFLASLPAQTRVVWLSRPAIREFQVFGLRANGLAFAVVGGSLILAGLIVVAALALRG